MKKILFIILGLFMASCSDNPLSFKEEVPMQKDFITATPDSVSSGETTVTVVCPINPGGGRDTLLNLQGNGVTTVVPVDQQGAAFVTVVNFMTDYARAWCAASDPLVEGSKIPLEGSESEPDNWLNFSLASPTLGQPQAWIEFDQEITALTPESGSTPVGGWDWHVDATNKKKLVCNRTNNLSPGQQVELGLHVNFGSSWITVHFFLIYERTSGI